jgi:hypothetical protein
MHQTLRGEPAREIEWRDLRPVIDAAMFELNERDREAILLRFFDGCSLAEVGAVSGLGQNAARMRVERALERLRERLGRRGITSTIAAVSVALGQQPIIAVPAGLAASVAGSALASASAGGVASTLIFMTMTKWKTLVVASTLVGCLGGLFVIERRAAQRISAAANASAALIDELAAERRASRRLAAELARTQIPSASQDGLPAGKPVADPLAPLRMMVDLEKRGLMRRGLGMIEVEGRIQQPWIEVFNLSPAETDAVNGALASARQRIGKLELKYASAKVENPGRLVITVQPFVDGAGVYDELLRSLAQVLGPERYPAFAALGLKEVEDHLNLLGMGTRTLTLTRTVNAPDPKRAYSLVEQTYRPDGTRKLGTATGPSVQGVISFLLGPLETLVPPGF